MKLIDINTSNWAIVQNKLFEMRKIYDTHMAGPKIDFESIKEKVSNFSVKQYDYNVTNGIAIINIAGVLTKRTSIIDFLMFGTSSTSQIKNIFIDALNDDEVDAILLYIDSPGGAVDGTQELAQAVYGARGIKPVYAFSDGMIASGAYWIASATDKIYISSDTVEVGSIGVVTTHADYSKMDEKDGVFITEIVAGKYKRIASSNKPLSEEGEEYLQASVDYLYSIFVDDVAKHRGVSVDTVIDDMADGKMFIGKQAIDAGLVDGVSTYEQLIEYISDNKLSLIFANTGISNAKINDYASGVDAGKNLKEIEMITLNDIASKYPDIYEAIMKEGYQKAMDEQQALFEQVKSDGIVQERERIKSIYQQEDFGHSELKEKFMFDGEISAGDAAIKFNQAEKAIRDGKLKAIDSDAIDPVAQTEPQDDKSEPKSFLILVSDYCFEHKCSKAVAIKEIAELYPAEYENFLKERNKRGKK